MLNDVLVEVLLCLYLPLSLGLFSPPLLILQQKNWNRLFYSLPFLVLLAFLSDEYIRDTAKDK